MSEMIDKLYEMVIETNAGEGHMEFNGIKKDVKATAVVSVYHGVRPSHKVLDDLYDWAEEEQMDRLMEKIQELQQLGNNDE